MTVFAGFVEQNASSKDVDKDVAARSGGAVVKRILFSFEKGAHTDTSVWRVGKISPHAKIVSIKLACDALTGLTDLDIGLYKPLSVGGAAIDKACFKDGLDPHAGLSTLTEEYLVAIADVGKEAWQIAAIDAADVDKYGEFDVALTGNTAGTAEGTISGIIEYVD
jgi:hypothetical protein